MPRSLLLLILVLALSATACGGDDKDGDEGDDGSMTAEPAGTMFVPPTGVVAPNDPVGLGIRSLVTAATAGNTAAIERAILYSPVPCTTEASGIGGPPLCREGEELGTPVDVVFATTCEGYFARRGELALDQIDFGAPATGEVLYGLYEIDEASQLARVEAWAGATHAVVLNTTAPTDAVLPYVFITNGANVVGTATGCGESPEEWVASQSLGEPIELP